MCTRVNFKVPLVERKETGLDDADDGDFPDTLREILGVSFIATPTFDFKSLGGAPTISSADSASPPTAVESVATAPTILFHFGVLRSCVTKES